MAAIITNDGRGGGGASYRAHRSGIGRKAEGRSAARRIQSSGRKIKNLLDLLHVSVWGKARRKCFFRRWSPLLVELLHYRARFPNLAAASCFLSRLQLRLFFFFSATLQAAKKNNSGWSFSRRLKNQFSRETSGKKMNVVRSALARTSAFQVAAA